MSTLVERLRLLDYYAPTTLFLEAADRIEALEVEVERLHALVERPGSGEVEAGARLLLGMRDTHNKNYTLDIVDQDNLTLVAALLHRLGQHATLT